MTAGKTTSFAEDTNLPFVVRGPGVPAGVKSHLPGAHIDLAPTFLKIAGVEESDFPPFLDGRSLLEQWHDPGMQYPAAGEGNVQEVLNVEYWGSVRFDYPWGPTFDNATYKSLRIVGQQFGYLYNHWCGTNERELYNTVVSTYSGVSEGEYADSGFKPTG